MLRLLVIGLVLLGLQGGTFAQSEREIFTIYLVRHAEKELNVKDPGDPSLSVCGELRVQALARILGDIKLERVYSTPFERTLDTARPIAESKHLEIESYDPSGLEKFSQMLLNMHFEAQLT